MSRAEMYSSLGQQFTKGYVDTYAKLDEVSQKDMIQLLEDYWTYKKAESRVCPTADLSEAQFEARSAIATALLEILTNQTYVR